ncbi:thymidylate synthase [Gordonia phage Sixama]|uniref:thymidylate synthase n=1 Tax=Gordonia phage Sixama TaxID=2653271 RepID=A0A5Q2F1C4_9CAUD|nr:thymidylate synthase [Gordonia phage Sixama]QGF20329.1 thymidylate synthase [Gordonia phage Sixama]
MLVYSSPYAGYTPILGHILEFGKPVSSRAGGTLEIENFAVTFLTSTDGIPPRRPGFSPLLGLMEGAQLIGQFARPRLMDRYWPKVAEYTDHHGDYGARVEYGNQIENVVKELKSKPDSRRAIITLWHPLLDNDPGHQDYPCTIMIAFRIRDHKLNMTVTMRSNDIWRGASSDFIQFSLLHLTVAALVGIDPGTYCHQALSMHLYDSDRDVAMAWWTDTTQNGQKDHGFSLTPLAEHGWDYASTMDEATSALMSSKNAITTMGKRIESMMMARARKLEGMDDD